MKIFHIILIFGLCSRIHAQQSPATLTHIVENGIVDLDSDKYYNLTYNQTANWYVSTDPIKLQTTILFMDKNKRVIYTEKLSGNYVELTTRNRRVLDVALARLTSQNLVTSKLKIKPFPYNQRGVPVSESENLPIETAATGPTGIQTRVLIMNKNLLYVWMQAPLPERVTLLVQDPSGKTMRLHTDKTDQFTDSLPLIDLPEGSYQVRLYGKTWEKEYEVHIFQKNHQVRMELVSK